jgi:diaminopimelate epimerase
MELDIVSADPAGNITIFVLTPIDDPALRVRAAKALLADPSLKAEQVGFVIPPEGQPVLPAAARRWRLDMMGGEFCGNAARSFGLYVARETGLAGKQDIPIAISGARGPVMVRADLGASTAEAELAGPRMEGVLAYGGRSFPVFYFEGITHVIAGGLEPGRDLTLGLLETARRTPVPGDPGRNAGGPASAFGVMFYDPDRRFLRPVVYVDATDSLVFESSCGSGTAALGVYLSAGMGDGEGRWDIAQPGGLITARVEKRAGSVRAVSIGGPVTLGGRRRIAV